MHVGDIICLVLCKNIVKKYFQPERYYALKNTYRCRTKIDQLHVSLNPSPRIVAIYSMSVTSRIFLRR